MVCVVCEGNTWLVATIHRPLENGEHESNSESESVRLGLRVYAQSATVVAAVADALSSPTWRANSISI